MTRSQRALAELDIWLADRWTTLTAHDMLIIGRDVLTRHIGGLQRHNDGLRCDHRCSEVKPWLDLLAPEPTEAGLDHLQNGMTDTT